MAALDLLSGDAQTFREKVWATRIHVHHGQPDDFVGLLSLDDVDHLLTSTALRTPALRLAHDGSVLPSAKYTRSGSLAGQPLSGLVDARKVLDLFESGATVVLQGLQRYWPPLTALARRLERELGHPCQANAYLTPPGSQGFAVHTDSHDVFVLQTHGSKRWEVHEDTDVREVLLEPGTCMYLPTGTPHAARTGATASLHVTLGINQVTWRQVLGRVTESLLADDSYDAHVPAGYLDDPAEFTAELGRRLTALSDRAAEVDAANWVAREAGRFLRTRSSELRGGLADRLALAAIDDDSFLRRRDGAVCEVSVEPGGLRLSLGDRELLLPTRLRPAVEHIRDRGGFRPADLREWLDLESRLVLVRRLVREGLLRVDA